MRRLLAVLRDTDRADRRARSRHWTGLDELVEQVRESGLAVHSRPRAPGAAPGVDLSAYRIVQEALTNVLKHAGTDARADVGSAYGADELVVSVDERATRRVAGTPRTRAGRDPRTGLGRGRHVEAGPGRRRLAVRARLPYPLEPR